MRKEILLPAGTLAAGVGGLFLRRWELGSAFEADTGLPIPGAPAMWALLGFSALMAVALLLLCRGPHQPFPEGYDKAFAAKGNTVYLLAMLLAAIALLGSGFLEGMGLPAVYEAALGTETNPLIAALPAALLALLSLASAAAVASLGWSGYRGTAKVKYRMALLMPAYMTCLWLISAYQKRAGDPVRQDYIYEIFAIIAVLLALYFISSFSFEKAKVFRACLFSLLGIYLCLVTLADAHNLAATLRYVFAILYLTADVTALLYHDSPRPMPVSAEAVHPETEDKPDEQ